MNHQFSKCREVSSYKSPCWYLYHYIIYPCFKKKRREKNVTCKNYLRQLEVKISVKMTEYSPFSHSSQKTAKQHTRGKRNLCIHGDEGTQEKYIGVTVNCSLKVSTQSLVVIMKIHGMLKTSHSHKKSDQKISPSM